MLPRHSTSTCWKKIIVQNNFPSCNKSIVIIFILVRQVGAQTLEIEIHKWSAMTKGVQSCSNLSKTGRKENRREATSPGQRRRERDTLLSSTSRKCVLLLVTTCVPRDTLFYLHHEGGALDSRRYLSSVRSSPNARVRLSPKQVHRNSH